MDTLLHESNNTTNILHSLCPSAVLISTSSIGRLVRLIPDNGDPSSEASAIKELFNHRLPSEPKEARLEWLEIVESLHPLWRQISTPKKELIRSFLNLVNQEIVKRMRPSSRFDFSSASIGNLFLTGSVSHLQTTNLWYGE